MKIKKDNRISRHQKESIASKLKRDRQFARHFKQRISVHIFDVESSFNSRRYPDTIMLMIQSSLCQVLNKRFGFSLGNAPLVIMKNVGLSSDKQEQKVVLTIVLSHDEQTTSADYKTLKSLVSEAVKTSGQFDGRRVSIRRGRFRERTFPQTCGQTPARARIVPANQSDPLIRTVTSSLFGFDVDRRAIFRSASRQYVRQAALGAFLISRTTAPWSDEEMKDLDARAFFLTIPLRHLLAFPKMARRAYRIILKCLLRHPKSQKNPDADPVFMISPDVEGTRDNKINANALYPHAHALLILPRAMIDGLSDAEISEMLANISRRLAEGLCEICGEVWHTRYENKDSSLLNTFTYVAKAERFGSIQEATATTMFFPMEYALAENDGRKEIWAKRACDRAKRFVLSPDAYLREYRVEEISKPDEAGDGFIHSYASEEPRQVPRIVHFAMRVKKHAVTTLMERRSQKEFLDALWRRMGLMPEPAVC